MKFSLAFSLFCLLLLTSVMFASGCGCLDGCLGECLSDRLNPADKNSQYFCSSADDVFTEGDELFVHVSTILRDNHHTLLEDEIQVNRTGNTIRLTISVRAQRFVVGEDYAFEQTNVSIGKISEYDNSGDFIVLVNKKPKEMNSVRFSVEDGVLYKYAPAGLANGKFILDGDDIIHVVTVSLFNNASNVDYSRISDPGRFDENNFYSVSLPVKTKEGEKGEKPVTERQSTVRFKVGNQKELPDGKYVVSVNGNDLSFEIQNQTMINEKEYETIWFF